MMDMTACFTEQLLLTAVSNVISYRAIEWPGPVVSESADELTESCINQLTRCHLDRLRSEHFNQFIRAFEPYRQAVRLAIFDTIESGRQGFILNNLALFAGDLNCSGMKLAITVFSDYTEILSRNAYKDIRLKEYKLGNIPLFEFLSHNEFLP